MDFGTIIKKLRRDTDMTQEQLANTLSVSAQAVSRWETNTAMPDISLLPPLANLFNVTTDYLLGVDITKSEQRIREIFLAANQASYEQSDCGRSDGDKTALAIIRDGLRLYPNSWKLKDRLAEYLSYEDAADNNKEYADNLSEANRINEEIIERCPDSKYRFDAIERICRFAKDSNNVEHAIELAKTMPTMTHCREEMTLRLLEGNEFEVQCRDYISVLEICLKESLKCLANGKSPDIVLSYYTKAEVIARTLYEDDDFIKSEYFWYGQSAWAKVFAQSGYYDHAFKCLEKEIGQYHHTIEHCFAFMSDLVPEYIRRECGNVTSDDIKERFCNKAKNTLEHLEDDFPESFKSDSRYAEIKEKFDNFIRKYSK